MWDVRLQGAGGSILWGHRLAVELRTWRIRKNTDKRTWTLRGVPARVDVFLARQTPLLFTAPRDKGMWMWAIEQLDVRSDVVVARLGPPER